MTAMWPCVDTPRCQELSGKKPYLSAKEPYISTQELGISAQEYKQELAVQGGSGR